MLTQIDDHNLREYLAKHEVTVLTCPHSLLWTERFCIENGLNFHIVKEELNSTGILCDCEVLQRG